MKSRHLAFGALLLLACLSGTALAGSWEFNVCAEPANLPFSNRSEAGFENEIARIVAEELDANLSYTWLPRPTSRYREIYLRSGRCDAVMGVAGGDEGFAKSLAYYRSSYVFVTRRESGVSVESLDDPLLRELRVAVSGGGRTGPERLALAERGIIENQLIFDADYSRPDPGGAAIEAVLEGRADLAVSWGPVAGYAARQAGETLDLTPVPPHLGDAFLPMVIPISIGVRPHDEALRDTIDRALASRWDEVQAVLASFGVPLEPLPEPRPPLEETSEPVRIGLVLPTPSGSEPIEEWAPDAAALAALQGAVLAEEAFDGDGAGLELLVASAPGPEAARRAAERLLGPGRAVGIVGGLGEGQVQLLGRMAEDHEALFFNIGMADEPESGTPGRHTFHLGASEAQYLDAIARAGVRDGMLEWQLVHDDESLAERAAAVLEEHGALASGLSEVGSGGFGEALDEIAASNPDAVLLLLDWRSQLEFLGLYDALGHEPPLLGMPYPMTQTRTFYLALQMVSVDADALRRIVLWDPGLEPAAGLAESYYQRWGSPMEAPAWAAYQAVAILHEAILQEASGEVGRAGNDHLVEHLERYTFDVAKGEPMGFDESHRLQQPLYLVRVAPDGPRLAEPLLVLDER